MGSGFRVKPDKVSTANKDIKPEDAAKQRQEIEAETKVSTVGVLLGLAG